MNNYTHPELREYLKTKILQGNKGASPGIWSARKAQLLRREYEELGGWYLGKKTQAQKNLTKWTQQEWTTKSGLPSLLTGERYLPRKAIEALTTTEYINTSKKKMKDLLQGKQYSKQPKEIKEKVRKYRK